MANFEKDLAQYESPLGVVSGETLRVWYKESPDLDEKYTTLITDPITYRGSHVPSGYLGEKGSATPVKHQMISLIVALAKVKCEHRYTLQEACDILKLSGVKLSRPGLMKVLPRIAKSLGITHAIPRLGRLTKVETLADAEKLVQRERKRFAKRMKKEGLTGDAVKKELDKELGREIPKIPKETPVEAPKEGLKKSFKDSNGLHTFDEEGKEYIDGRPVIYNPLPKQSEFHSASEDVVLYGGAAGGGKSYALIFDAVRYAHVPRYRAVIIRRTMPELMELIETSKEFYPQMFPGCKFNTQKNLWRFPSGALVEFGYLDKPNDKLRYQGQQYQYIAFDELGQWPDSEGWDYLGSRLRKPPIDPHTGKPIPVLRRATSNPGASWVKEMFIDAAPWNTTFYNRAGLSYRFIPAKLDDNFHIDNENDHGYRKQLESLPETLRQQLLLGNWDATETAAFPEFRPDGYTNVDLQGTQQLVTRPHVVEPFEIPKWWNRVCGMDYGYRDPASAVWIAINPQNGQKIVYREYSKSERTGMEFGADCRELEADELIPIDHVLDWAAFNRTGASGPTIGEEIRRSSGFALRPADKNRKAGKVQIHENLRAINEDKDPGLIIFNTCPVLINQLRAAQIKPSDPDDIDQTRAGENKHHWDAYDALRYALMARPTRQNRADMFNRIKRQSRWDTVNNYFK